MKKRYVKPEIIFESFSMSGSIAGSCEEIVNFTQDTCPVITSSGQTVFTAEMSPVCMFTPQNWNLPPDMWNGFCYHIPIDTKNLFNS